MKHTNFCHTHAQLVLISQLRQLWEQHIMWTRSFIISTVEDIGDLEDVTNRLLENPKDFADYLLPFYGELISCEFETQFTNHVKIGGLLVKELKDGDMEAACKTREKWYQNAEELACFLSSINSEWDSCKWKKMLYSHLEMTECQAQLRIECKYIEDIQMYQQIENEALEMADSMSFGLIRQFCYC